MKASYALLFFLTAGLTGGCAANSSSSSLNPYADPKVHGFAAAYVTVNGTVYTYEPNAPAAMQPAYRDPQGLVWGDRLDQAKVPPTHNAGFPWRKPWAVCENQDNQNPGRCAVDYPSAKLYCESIRWDLSPARLPTRNELRRLRESMVTIPTPAIDDVDPAPGINSSYDSSKPALPHLTDSAFWSGTLSSDERQAYVFGGANDGSGFIPRNDLSGRAGVRCVF